MNLYEILRRVGMGTRNNRLDFGIIFILISEIQKYLQKLKHLACEHCYRAVY